MTMDKLLLLSLASLLAFCACASAAPASARQKSLLSLLGMLEKLTPYRNLPKGGGVSAHAQSDRDSTSGSGSRGDDPGTSRSASSLLQSALDDAGSSDDGGMMDKRQGGWWTYDYGLGGGRFGKRNYGEYGIGGGRYGRDVDHVDVASSF